VVAAEVGNLLSVQHAFSTFWPPAGVFMAVLLISPRRDWPVLIAAAVAGNLCSDLLHGRSLLMTAGFSTANALESVVGAVIVGRLIGSRPKLDSMREALVFAGAGALLAPVVGATAGTSVVMYFSPAAVWSTVWASWWIGDALGIVLVGSVILTWIARWDSLRDDPAPTHRTHGRPVVIALLIALPFAFVAQAVFAPLGGATSWKFLITPGMVGVGMVGGPQGAAAGLLIIALGAMSGMIRSAPIAVLESAATAARVFQAQAFFVVGGITTLVLAGAIAESRRNAASAETAATQFSTLFDTMREGVAYCRMIFEDGEPVDWVYLQVNEAFGELTGLHDVLGRHVWEVLPELAKTNPELYDLYGTVALTGVPVVFESNVVPIHRTLRLSVTSPGKGDFVSVFEDVTDRVLQEQELADSHDRLEKMVYDVAEAMGSVVEARDPYTQGHEVRVASLGMRIAREMGLSVDAVNEINMAGLLHDIGKLRVPAEILTKPGQLSAPEFALIHEHPEQGYEILRHIDFPWPIAEIVRQHHERLDGSGYPRGLKDGSILLSARILAVADVVEAMASHRPYRPALGLSQAIGEISSRPELYDADVVAACMRLDDRGEIVL
jgi:putative nucleotidyltransferase with HDIG domain